MKIKINYLLLAILLLFSFNKVAKACDYSDQVELNALASNVKAYYEVSPEPKIYFTININNLQENVYAVVTNSVTKEETIYEYTSENKGHVSFVSDEIHKKVEFVISLYAKKPGCNGIALRTIRVITPKYNMYYTTYMCQDIKEFVLCQKWSDFTYSSSEMKAKVDEYKANLVKTKEEEKKVVEQDWLEKVLNFITDNKVYFIIAGSVIVIGIITTIIIHNKRRVL